MIHKNVGIIWETPKGGRNMKVGVDIEEDGKALQLFFLELKKGEVQIVSKRVWKKNVVEIVQPK